MNGHGVDAAVLMKQLFFEFESSLQSREVAAAAADPRKKKKKTVFYFIKRLFESFFI